MTDQHRATDSEWYCLKARTCGDKADQVAYSTIHELLHRIETLEAAAQPAQSNHPAKPDSSLVDQVEDALDMARGDSEAKARAAIREVATWMTSNRDHHFPPALVFALEQEAER